MDEYHGIHNIELFSRYCFYAGLGIGFVVTAGVKRSISFIISDLNMIPGCSFYAATGYYCSGCGGTRGMTSILQGRILDGI